MNLNKITYHIQDELTYVETYMQQAMYSDVSLINDIVQHIADGGKRIRPVVTLLVCGCFHFADTKKRILAASIEFIHTATLLHDDVVDNSTKRRGKQTANTLWGNESSVLVGDFLYSRAFQSLVDIGHLPLMQIIAQASNKMAEGEVLQLTNRHNPSITEQTYYDIINAKTATLFQAATKMAAVLSNADSDQIKAMSNYGKHLGLAFQLIDDALDYSSNADTFGKNIGDDIAEGKITMPLLFLLYHSNEQHASLIKESIATGGIEQLTAIKTAVCNSQAVQYTKKKAHEHSQLAKASLDCIADSPYKSALLNLAEFVVMRDH